MTLLALSRRCLLLSAGAVLGYTTLSRGLSGQSGLVDDMAGRAAGHPFRSPRPPHPAQLKDYSRNPYLRPVGAAYPAGSPPRRPGPVHGQAHE